MFGRLALALSVGPFLVLAQDEPLRVLVFSKTEGYRHASIPEGIRALETIGAERGWEIVATEDASTFNDADLAGFDVAVWLLTTGDVLNQMQEYAFERFIRSGKGYVGIHSAADTEHAWPWYGRLVGAYFTSHAQVEEATYVVEDRLHPATDMLPLRWTRVDEHYSFDRNPRARVNVLLSLDETSYDPGEGAMGDHPIAWYHEIDGVRAFYTGLGHTAESYENELFLDHIAGAIFWAAGPE